jgi:hypothetical protein
MSPWNKIENSFFSMVYSVYYKQLTLSWFWKGRVNRFKFTFAFQKTDLIDDSKYKSERERYKKEEYAGYIQTQAKQRPHHTGTHYNIDLHDKDEKWRKHMSSSERDTEIRRREDVARTSGVRPHVGQNNGTKIH